MVCLSGLWAAEPSPRLWKGRTGCTLARARHNGRHVPLSHHSVRYLTGEAVAWMGGLGGLGGLGGATG